MGLSEIIRFRFLPYWKTYLLILLPLILLPLLLNGEGGKEARAGYVIILMAIYWMTEALPLAITSLLPVVLFPLFGVMDTGKVCMAYMKETNMMFIGGLMVALTIENCNLHRRIALRVLLFVGSSPRWLMLGFMLTTMFLSMWISNTATTAMMVPIVDAIIEELFKNDDEEMKKNANVRMVPDASSITSCDSKVDVDDDTVQSYESGSVDSISDVGKSCQKLTTRPVEKQRDEYTNMRKCALLAVAYSANIGGTGTIIGSGTNLVLKGVYKELYGSSRGLNFASWMAFNVPGMLINTFIAWIWLQFLFVGFKRSSVEENARSGKVKGLILKKYEELGAMSFHEIATSLLFVLCVALWFFRDPQFIPGWAEILNAVEVDDATAVMAVVVLLFVIPAKPKFWSCSRNGERGPDEPSPALIEWKYLQDKIPWGIVLLLGGGFAISDASKISGLSHWIGLQLSGLRVLHPFLIMVIICLMTAIITEVASNTATANILLPVLADMAKTIQVDPLFLMLPATVTCSYAFCLPVATPPNAIVFAAARMNPIDMAKAGFFMNLICVMVICILMATFGDFIFNFDELPSSTTSFMNETITTLSPLV